jgi:urease accessory protein UreE
MIVSQSEVKNRLEQLKLSYEGYSRQLARLDLSQDRRDRLETSVRLLQEEMSTLETLAQFGRVEPDRDKIEAEVRDRLAVVRARLENDPTLSGLPPEERYVGSGAARALQWALGEDRLTRYTEEWARETAPDPNRLAQKLPAFLTRAVLESSDPNARASAAYDLGNLHITESIPALAQALAEDEPEVAQAALDALGRFGDEELRAAGLPDSLVDRIAAARGAPGT